MTQLAVYFELIKPKVVTLIVFTAIVGMFLAVPGMPPWQPIVFGTLGIGLAAASAAAINHVLDARIDAEMKRTRHRPLPAGQLGEKQASVFAVILGVISMLILVFAVNTLTALMTFLSLIGYAFIYTVYLKRATPQNIVIGGAAGAAPPVLGWMAVTNTVDLNALLLFLIIFAWTPPHFWALAIARKDEYAKVNIPMMPVIYGVKYTQRQILLYTILLFIVSILPYFAGLSGPLYLFGAVMLGSGFLYYAIAMMTQEKPELPMRTFAYSVNYLMALFAFLLVDHYL